MRERIYLGVGFTLSFVAIICALILSKNIVQKPVEKEWEVTVDLTAPDCLETPYGVPCGHASIKLPIGCVTDPRKQLGEILSGTFSVYGGQYYTWSMIENIFEKEKACYKYDLWDADEDLRNPDIPPIRQDNVGERFCFFAWRHIIHPHPKENGKLTVVLPEGYELENVSGRPEHWSSDISATAAEFLDNRWWVTAWSTERGELFLRIDYRKL